MKRLVLFIGFLLLGSSVALAIEHSTIVRVTTYWREEGQLRAASNGSCLRDGHCAVDPKLIPYGSKILLGNEELIAVDTGPAVVSRKAARVSGRNAAERNAIVVDRYFETRAQAAAWEKSHPHFVQVRIVPPKSGRTKSAAHRIAEKQLTDQKCSPSDAKSSELIASTKTGSAAISP
jgi:hypothetical protein